MRPNPSRRAAPYTAFAGAGPYRHGGLNGFVSGFLHPLSGLDHVVAMVAVGIWGAQLGLPALWVLPVTFPVVMAFGGVLGVFGVPLPAVEYGIAFSGIVLGLMVAFAVRVPLWFAGIVVAVFAIFMATLMGGTAVVDRSGLLLRRFRARDRTAARLRHCHRPARPLARRGDLHAGLRRRHCAGRLRRILRDVLRDVRRRPPEALVDAHRCARRR